MSEFLRFLSKAQRDKLLASAKRSRFEAEEVVLAEGEERRALFMIRSGVVRVERSHMGFNVEISRLGTGEIFGEMSFVEDFGASASVVADEPVEIDVVDEPNVTHLIQSDPDFSGRFYRSLAEVVSRRLRETTILSIAEYSWGGYGGELEEQRESDEAWGGGSPLRDTSEV